MSVSLEPSTQLSFRKPFSALVKQILRVNNYNSQPVAFKVKTTAPKLYCVRPNSGKIEPGESVEVQVLLQPMKEDPPSLKCKDKFLVQSTLISPELGGLSVNELWSTVTEDAGKIHQQKLKVVYLPSEGALPEEDEPDASGMGQSSMLSHEGDSSRYETTRHHYDTAKPHTNGSTDNPGIPIFDNADPVVGYPRADSPPRPHTPDHAFSETQEHAHDEIQPIGRPSAATTIPVSSYDHSADYAAKLAAANAEITKLQALLADANNNGNDLRRRSRLFSDDGSVMQDGMTEDGGASVIVERVQPEGVPLNVVAMLSLVVFVVTYLFF